MQTKCRQNKSYSLTLSWHFILMVMASIRRSISSQKGDKGEILLRINIDRTHQQRIKSGIFIKKDRFRDKEIIKPRANRKEAEELTLLENELVELERFIITLCQSNSPETLTKEFILESIDNFRHPEKAIPEEEKIKDIYDALNEYIDTSGLSIPRLNHYRVICRALKRYELYKQKSKKTYSVGFDTIDEKVLKDLVDFLKAEPELFDKYPDIYEEVPAITRTMRKPRKPLPRGENTIVTFMQKFKAFYNWAIRKGYVEKSPFVKFTVGSEKYGTPFYLTTEERNKLADYDFSNRPALEVQRDIFIFQCLTGCRVSDLYGLTTTSVIDGAIEYIPSKTKRERANVVRVPLNEQARALIKKYNAKNGEPLFPFISSQKYNDKIKEMIKLAEINRIVTILDSVTGEEVKKPLYEVASSHMARRTFIGNLYKKVKDPNLVGSLSGHKEGSKAFARYRDIDEDMKKELVSLL